MVLNNDVILKLQTNTDRNAKRRRDIGVFITQKCIVGENTITVMKQNDTDHYALGVFVVEH